MYTHTHTQEGVGEEEKRGEKRERGERRESRWDKTLVIGEM